MRVNAVQIADVISLMERWIRERRTGQYVAVTGMHGLTEARQDPRFRDVLDAADLVVPDGMPLIWLGRRHGHTLERRVYGPELMQSFCHRTGPRYRHFFFGGAPSVPERLAKTFQHRYGIRVAGAYSPPFRPWEEREAEEIVAQIQNSSPDVVWVGLGTPKQEYWIFAQRDRLRIPVMVGVGAAFDFATGRVKQAPPWMREHGLEWLFRLMHEPRRLWRRYLIYGCEFAWNASLELLNVKKFE